jgi:hypothetical protein
MLVLGHIAQISGDPRGKQLADDLARRVASRRCGSILLYATAPSRSADWRR